MYVFHEMIQSFHFRRVLEDIREAANKVTPQTEGAFFRTMPFGYEQYYLSISLIYLDCPSLQTEYDA